MKHWRKRLLSAMLALILVVGLIQINVSAATTPAKVNATTAAARVQTLRNFVNNNSYGYSYFTTTGTNCANKSSDHGCSKCLTTNLLTTSWIKNGLGLMANSDSLLPFPRWASPSEAATYGKIGTIDAPAYSCVGFAMMAHWFIYAQKNTDNVAAEHIATINLSSSSAQTNLAKYAREGDMLVFRTSKTNGNYSHAAIYTGCTSSAVKVLDSNWGGSTGNTCKMQEHTISYSTYAYVEISRATNATDETVAATSVSLATTEINLDKGNTYALSETVWPSNATNKAVTWSSSNTAVATVSSSGVVKGIAPGQATITVTTKDGGHKATCAVTVSGDVYTITYDLNGGEWDKATTQTKNEGEDLTLISTVPTRPGYTFLGWESLEGVITEGEWTTEQPTGSDYETGYKYYTYGYEHNSDYTYMYGPNKDSLISTVKEYPDGYGTYSASKLRYFWLIEDTNQGESFYPAKIGDTASNFSAPYRSETGVSGTATIRNTVFYFESMVYKQIICEFPVYQPGETFKRDENVTLTAVWDEDADDSSSNVYTVTYDLDGGEWNESNTQTKKEDEPLVLTNSIPSRSGYTFLTWICSDIAVEYAPGDTYVENRNVTLIAVWSEDAGNSNAGTTGDCTWSFDGSTLTISGNGAMAVYTFSTPAPWYDLCDSGLVRALIVEGGVQHIGNNAFDLCAMSTVTLPSSVTSIGSGAFGRCTNLTSITIPNSVTSIGDYAFMYCNSLSEITIPESITSIGNQVFMYCSKLTSVTIPNTVTTIGINAFSDCSELTDVWYGGSETDRSNISIDETGNDKIMNATWHYTDSTEPDTSDHVYHDVAYLSCNSFYPHPGDTISVFLTVPEAITVRSLGIENLDYNMEKLELISGNWLLDNALIADWNNNNRVGAATFLENTNIQDNILELTFKIKDDASECDLSISLDFKGTLMGDTTETTIFHNTESIIVPVRILDPIEIAVSNVNCRPGDTIEVFLSIPEATAIKTIGIPFIMYDNSVLELIDGEWLLDTAIVSDWNTEELIGAMTFAENTIVSGNFIKFTFTVKDDAPEGTTDILCAMTLKQMVGNFEATIPHQTIGGSITVTHVLSGDMDGNEAVNSNDVVFLLYHTLFPSTYPANQNADFNHDGAVNSNDVIFLLYHTLFPTMYPLT